MSLQTPRILPAHLHAFHPSSANSKHTVRILGTVSALRGDTATITCGSAGETVTIILNPDSRLQMGKLVEIIGKVTDLDEGGIGIRLRGCTDLGDPADCDYKIYEQVVNATHKLKSIFYDANE
ncbi:putative ssDNA binding protein Ssb3 [Aspergillus saccharolyticus JOP 1030-1]|uniref:Replication factor A protein 3 n=1 Tax=Aspergillus saccharolyticus JOP 1030-1 TaxID=1450539 RepID=A0A318Z8Z2_9EURO|nr:replication factor A protein 3 [Aspergillus saccharolyticus JOP 1030-1]PYH43835.1 replication factor A protein 3 [Aspergillus saccharolyticus JOP 1030-1]